MIAVSIYYIVILTISFFGFSIYYFIKKKNRKFLLFLLFSFLLSLICYNLFKKYDLQFKDNNKTIISSEPAIANNTFTTY